jgi:hypothetical protein
LRRGIGHDGRRDQEESGEGEGKLHGLRSWLGNCGRLSHYCNSSMRCVPGARREIGEWSCCRFSRPLISLGHRIGPVSSGFARVGELLPNMNCGETGFSWLAAGGKWRFRESYGAFSNEFLPPRWLTSDVEGSFFGARFQDFHVFGPQPARESLFSTARSKGAGPLFGDGFPNRDRLLAEKPTSPGPCRPSGFAGSRQSGAPPARRPAGRRQDRRRRGQHAAMTGFADSIVTDDPARFAKNN